MCVSRRPSGVHFTVRVSALLFLACCVCFLCKMVHSYALLRGVRSMRMCFGGTLYAPVDKLVICANIICCPCAYQRI